MTIYDTVTSNIIAALEAGAGEWTRPWGGGNTPAPLRHCGTPYRGINILILWITAKSKGYAAPTWMTYRQAAVIGGQVRKGEKGTAVVYSGTVSKEDESGEEASRFNFLKSYTVFNAQQIDGLPEVHTITPVPVNRNGRRADVDAFFAKIGSVVVGGAGAAYVPSLNIIEMPAYERFTSAGGYYATLAHEHVHWTGHTSRLNRDLEKKFRGKPYAFEELIAEIGAAFVCSTLDIEGVHVDDHASYIASWLKVLREDNKAIFRAASAAQLAADYLLEKGRPV